MGRRRIPRYVEAKAPNLLSARRTRAMSVSVSNTIAPRNTSNLGKQALIVHPLDLCQKILEQKLSWFPRIPIQALLALIPESNWWPSAEDTGAQGGEASLVKLIERFPLLLYRSTFRK